MRRALACAAIAIGCGDNRRTLDEFAIAIDSPTVTIRRGDTQRVAVAVSRTAGSSDIGVSADALPDGVTVDELVVSPDEPGGVLTIHASDTAAEGIAMTSVVGNAPNAVASAPLRLVVAGAPGSLDLSFAGGKVIVDVPASTGRALMPAAGTVVAGGGTPDHVIVVRIDEVGAIDPRFGVDGVVSTNAGSGIAMANFIDDRMMVGGATIGTPTDGDFGVWSYNVVGTLDLRYGANGVATFDPGAGLAAIHTALIAPDLSLLAAGNLVDGTGRISGIATRFSVHGVADPAYAVVEPDVDFEAAIAQPDGKLVVAGSKLGELWLSRYTVDGSRDPAFGQSGAVTTSFAPDTVHACGVLAHSGTLIAVGVTTGASPRVVLAGYTADGVLDTTFGAAGTIITSVGFDTRAPNAVLIDPDNHLVIVGVTAGVPSVARIALGGAADPTFGIAGIAAVDFGMPGSGAGVAFDPEHRIVFTGAIGPAGDERMIVGRLWP